MHKDHDNNNSSLNYLHQYNSSTNHPDNDSYSYAEHHHHFQQHQQQYRHYSNHDHQIEEGRDRSPISFNTNNYHNSNPGQENGNRGLIVSSLHSTQPCCRDESVNEEEEEDEDEEVDEEEEEEAENGGKCHIIENGSDSFYKLGMSW